MECPKNCPYLNQFDVCEQAFRRIERVRVCPQAKTHKAAKSVSKMDTGRETR